MRRSIATILVCLGTALVAAAQNRNEPGRIFFFDGNRIASAEPSGEKRTQYPRVLASLGHFQPYTARVAPDGRRLAFGVGELRNQAGYPPSKLQIVDLTKDGRPETVVDLPNTELHGWTWSPDGKRLAVSSWDAENRVRNWTVNVETKKLEEVRLPRFKLADGESQMSIEDWSPDGKSFAAAGDGLFIVDVDGSNAKRLTAAKITIHGGTCRFSPDGRRLLFVGTEQGKKETLYKIEIGDKSMTPLVEFQNFSDLQAFWSPDGKRIAYSVTFLDAQGKRGNESNINVIDVDGKNSSTIATAEHEPQTIKLLMIGWR